MKRWKDGTSMGLSAAISNRPCVLPDNEINQKIRSLNSKQREIVEIVLTWAKKYVKARSCQNPGNVEPLHIFLTGQGGCGKSHLVKTIFPNYY